MPNSFFSENIMLVLIFLLIWLMGLSFLFLKIQLFFKKLTRGISTLDLKSILEEHLKKIKLISQEVADLEKRCDDIDKGGLLHLKKVGLVRFNPFSDTGGDQSFTLAILNDHNDGIVVSSLHGREQTRVFAKPIRDGQAVKYELSNEEKQAVERALKNVL